MSDKGIKSFEISVECLNKETYYFNLFGKNEDDAMRCFLKEQYFVVSYKHRVEFVNISNVVYAHINKI